MLPPILYDIAHVVAGFITILICPKYPIPSILATIIFIIYQLDEDYHIHDQAWEDIKEYLIGMFLGIITLFIMVLFDSNQKLYL